MKKILSIGFLLTALLLVTNTINAQKIGYFHSLALLAEVPAIKQADQQVMNYQKQLVKRGEEMVKKLEAKAKKAQADYEAGRLSPTQQEAIAKEIQKGEQDIYKYQQEVQQKVAAKREGLYEPILKNIDTKVSEIAKEGGYTYILDSSSGILLYADPALDVTAKIKSKLGL